MKCSSFFLLLALPYFYLSGLQPCRLRKKKNGSERLVCEKGGSRGEYALAKSTPRTHSAGVKVNPNGIRGKRRRRSSHIGPITGFDSLSAHAALVWQERFWSPSAAFHTNTPPPHKKQHMVRAQHQTTVCLPGVIYTTPNKHSNIRH